MHTSLESTPEAPWQGGRVSLRARCVLAHNASPMTYTGTNTWILSEPGSLSAYIIDPGPANKHHLDAIVRSCSDDDLRIEAILLTHEHLDHSAGAENLSEITGASIYSRAIGNLPDGLFSIPEGGPGLRVVSFPGHSRDSVGFCFSADHSIVSGDLVFLQSPTVITWPDGDLKEYFESLKFLKALVEQEGYTRLLSAHGAPVEDPLPLIAKSEAHRLNRLASVRGAIMRSGSLDLDYILEAVYHDIDTRLDPAARMNVQAQIEYLKGINDPCLSSRKA